jgi:polyhydroxybutyrate depolymerase
MRVRLTSVAVIFAVSVVGVPLSAQRGLRGRLAGRADTAGASLSHGTQVVTLTFHSMTRRYLLHAPPGANGALVLAFHGGGETPQNQEQISGLDALADRERFLVAYPEGIDKSWADGRGTTSADMKGIDDVGFAKAVVDDIATTHTVDRRRVFATGPSNGGIFANRLGCDAADTFAAVGPVIGPIASRLAPTCHPSAPVAVIGVQGVADPVVPFAGGEVGGTLEGAAAGGQVDGSRATQELWRLLDGCSATPASTLEPVRANDGTSVTRRVFSGCREGVDVVWYEIQGGGHRWPPHRAQGLAELVARRTLGVSSQNLDATEAIWTFFAAHPKRSRLRIARYYGVKWRSSPHVLEHFAGDRRTAAKVERFTEGRTPNW